MKSKLLFLVTEDWYFCSHRMALAKTALAEGFDVVLATRVTDHGERIRAAGIRLIPIKMQRGLSSVLAELSGILELIRIYKREKPDIVHHVAMKPILYGSIAARFASIPLLIQALTGFGFIFSSSTIKARLLRPPVCLLLRWILGSGKNNIVVQNPDDAALAENLGAVPERLHLIAGSGVNVKVFAHKEEPAAEPPVVTLVARMLRDKGIVEFVEAIRLLKKRNIALRALLVGDPDPENPASIPSHQLEQWQAEGLVEWQGRRSDIEQVWAESHIAVLPSYREGLPKSLLEAAACSRPMVATDMPGCRSVVRNGETGLLIPAKTIEPLADAIATLINNKTLRLEMGQRARQMVENEFSEEIINEKFISLYKKLLKIN